MNISENTLVFRLENDISFDALDITPGIRNFIADLTGVSVSIANSIKDKFITFDQNISRLNGAFVIVCDFSFDDDLTIVPTLQEAYDYIEMEEIERELKL